MLNYGQGIFMQKFSHSYMVAGRDMDLDYRMLPMAALAYYEDSFARYLGSRFLAAFDIRAQGLYWIISEIDMRIDGELPPWSESFDVELWISEKSRIKIYCDFTMSYGGRVFARGNCCWIVLDKNRKRPADTRILDGKVDIIEELAAGEHRKFEWQASEKLMNTLEHRVGMNDIDFNRHMNNRTYLDLAVACHMESSGFEDAVRRIRVKFMQECFVGDVLKCHEYGLEDNCFGYSLERDGSPVCQVILEFEKRASREPIEGMPLALRLEQFKP